MIYLLFVLAIPVPEVPAPQPPVVTFRGIEPNGDLRFEATNPNRLPLTVWGYLPGSYEPPLPEGSFMPTYQLEVLVEGKWQPRTPGWCKSGMGALPLPPRATRAFTVPAPGAESRVGLRWSAAGQHPTAVAWSLPVGSGSR